MELNTRLRSLLPLLCGLLLLCALASLLVTVIDTSRRRQRCADYIGAVRQWHADKGRSVETLKGSASPWGGAFKPVASFRGGEPALLLSGFPPNSEVQFDEKDSLALAQAWNAGPVPGVKLLFHFNGLPVALHTP